MAADRQARRWDGQLATNEVKEHFDTLMTDLELVTFGMTEQPAKYGMEGRLATAYADAHSTLANLYNLDLPQDTSKECAICYEAYSREDPAVQIRNVAGCNHVFGRRCLGLWIHAHNTCPTCRVELYTGATPEASLAISYAAEEEARRRQYSNANTYHS
jgi:hypothetical protein